MAKTVGIIITVAATIVAASIGILLWMVLSKRILRTQKSTISIVIPMMIGVVLLIIVALVVIIFFPQFIHTWQLEKRRGGNFTLWMYALYLTLVGIITAMYFCKFNTEALRKWLFNMRAPEIIIFCIVAMLTFGSVFWIWMLIDCALNRTIQQGPKTLWMVFILFTHWLGALIYFFTSRRLHNRANRVAYQPYAQPQEPYQRYQHGYHSPGSSSDGSKRLPMNPRNEQQAQQLQFHGEQPQASYPTEQQQKP